MFLNATGSHPLYVRSKLWRHSSIHSNQRYHLPCAVFQTPMPIGASLLAMYDLHLAIIAKFYAFLHLDWWQSSQISRVMSHIYLKELHNFKFIRALQQTHSKWNRTTKKCQALSIPTSSTSDSSSPHSIQLSYLLHVTG